MSVAGIHWAQDMRGVCPYRKALLYALGERHHKDANIVDCDQVMLAQDAGMTDRTVRKYLKMLVDDGLITVVTDGRRNRYRLHLSRKKPLSKPKAETQDVVALRKDIPESKSAEAAPIPENQVCDTGKLGTPHSILRHGAHDSSVSKETDVFELFPNLGVVGPGQSKASRAKPASKPKPKAPTETGGDEPRATKADLLKTQIFTVGSMMLRSQGMGEQPARAFLGRLIKQSNLEIVGRAVQRAVEECPIDAKGWLAAIVVRECKRAGIATKAPDSPEDRAALQSDHMAAMRFRFATLRDTGKWRPNWGMDPRIGVRDDVPASLYDEFRIPWPEHELHLRPKTAA